MIIYGLLLALVVGMGFLSILIGRKNKKLAHILVIVICGFTLYLLSALKDPSIGRDTSGYMEAYNAVAQQGWGGVSYKGFELGYLYFTKFCSAFGLSFQQFTFVAYFVVYFPICFLLYKKSPNPSISILAFIIFMLAFELSGLRQALAMSLALFSFYFFNLKKKPWSLICSAIFLIGAISMHVSALVMLILYGLYFLKFKMSYLLFFVPIVCILFFSSSAIYELIYHITKINDYLPGSYGGGGYFILFVLLMIWFVLIRKDSFVVNYIDNIAKPLDKKFEKINNFVKLDPILEVDDKFYNACSWGSLIVCLFYSFMRVNQVFPRYSFYFLILVFIALSSTIFAFKNKTIRLILFICIMLIGAALFVYLVMMLNPLDIVPYKFFFM